MDILAATVEVDLTVILGVITALTSVIGTLAGILWSQMNARLKVQVVRMENQDEHIASQDLVIAKLQEDVDRLVRGCGVDECVWRDRGRPPLAQGPR